MNSAAPAKNRRILVVDDNPSIHADFRKILCGNAPPQHDLSAAEAALFGKMPTQPPLGREGFELVSAMQGQDGLAAVEAAAKAGTPFAMAFVDVRMPPGWDGIETTARLWEIDPELQVVICTAYSDYSWEDMATRLGASDRLVILKKPFDVVEVLQLASALTAKWDLAQRVKSRVKDLEQAVAGRTQELQASNEQLLATQEKLNHFLAKSPAVLYSFRFTQGRPTPAWVSDNFARFFGGEIKDWYEQTPGLTYVDPQDRKAVQASFDALKVAGHVSLQYRVHGRDGKSCWVRDDRRLLKDVAGQPVEIIGCWTDITEQRLLEEELRQSQKMESIGLLAGGIAHDFNNLLTIIRCNGEMLLHSEELIGVAEDSLREILRAADRACELTRQLLAFSRKQMMRTTDLDLNEMLTSVASLLRRTLGEHIEVQTVCQPGLPAVLADRAMLEQVLMNLGVNARDAMTAGGRITIITSVFELAAGQTDHHPEARPGRYVCMSVTDTGCGIPPEILPRVFDPFFTTKEVGKGTGLGLATVYGIVKQHQGWVEAESKVGVGTTFKIFLHASATTPVASTPVAPTPLARGKNESILVVEDEPALRRLITITLQRQGYRVNTAASGAAALNEWLDKLEGVDLLLTDLVMPDGVTGLELARDMQARKAGLKVIYMSGYSAHLNRVEALVGEGGFFLAKPFGPQTLAEMVRTCLDAKQKRERTQM